MAVNVKALNQPYLYNYKYDQLNRLIAMDAYTGLNETTNTWAALTVTNKFKERVSYDANGNIKTYVRHHEFENAPMDDLTYYYTAGTNKLTHVKEGPNSQSWINGTKDIEDQVAGNYDYDEIGNLIKDASENIAPNGIQWNVYGKIASIERTAASNTSNAKKIIYDYDAAGNRIGKKVIKFGSARVEHTWYVRDATGNMLGVYTAGMDTTASTTLSNFALLHTESYLYGSSKLGVLNRMEDVEGTNYNGAMSTTWRGSKHFELSNHLGNVMAVISDKKLPIADPNNATLIAGYDAEVVSANDYYPFGMTSRSYNNGYGNYRTGFNGKENDKNAGEAVQDYGMRIYDGRLGRFLSLDPLVKSFPFYSPFHYAGNSPIKFIDLDGKEPKNNKADWMHTHDWANQDYNDDGWLTYYKINEKDEKGRNFVVRERTIGSFPMTTTQHQFYNYDQKQYETFYPGGFMPNYIANLERLKQVGKFGEGVEKVVWNSTVFLTTGGIGSSGVFGAGLGGRFTSSLLEDAIAQSLTTGFDYKAINLTSLPGNILSAKWGFWGGVGKNLTSSFGEANLENLQKTGNAFSISNPEFSYTSAAITASTGIVFDGLLDMGRIKPSLSWPQYTRARSLSYKPKEFINYMTQDKKYIYKSLVFSLSNNTGSGVTTNAAANIVGEKLKAKKDE